jgi:hemerythrin-like domain-containing protein
MIRQKNNFLINYKKDDFDFVEKLNLDKIYQETKEFFNFSNDIFIRLNFVYSPEEFVFFTGKNNFEKWFIGQTSHFNTIIIFSPSVVEKFTTHKKEEIIPIIAHEIAHLFYGNSGFVNLPLFNEGIATFIKTKYLPEQINFNFQGDYYPIKTTKEFKDNYVAGCQLIKKIILNKEKNKIFEFLKRVNEADNDEMLYQKFEKIFNKKPIDFIKMKGGLENES